MNHLSAVLSAVLLIVAAAAWSAGSPPVLAQSGASDPAELTPEQQKIQAKEERLAEYIRNKEQKRVVREQERLEREADAARALELESQQLAEQAANAEAGAEAALAAAALAPEPEPAATKKKSSLPKDLADAQAAIRLTPLGAEPTVQAYLDMIDRQEASPQQLAAFGSFLADAGANRLALIYYDVAIKLDKKDPIIWVNLGTLYRQLGDVDKAKSSFSHALAVNPADSVAHYNLGAILDSQGKYKQALEAYRVALTLDPTLGDPAYNPSAANNERLLAVKLMLYQGEAGNIGLPLVDVTGGDIDGIAPLQGSLSQE